MHVFCKLIRPA